MRTNKKRVTFVHTESESFAIELLSAILKEKGHQVSLVFDSRLFDSAEIKNSILKRVFGQKDLILKQVKDTKPDLICFSAFTYNYQWALDTAQQIKKMIGNTPIIFGGIHATLMPDLVINNKCVDYVCVGEGEGTLLELVNNLGKESQYKIKNLWLKKGKKIIKNEPRPLIKNLDELPFPDKDLFAPYHPIYRSGYALVAGRGCPYRCTFCCSNALKRASNNAQGIFIRKRSVKHVISELVWAKNKFKPPVVMFIDDVFVLNLEWLREFVPLYRKFIGLPFICDAHPAGVTPELVKLLKKAGCDLLIFGVQSASERVRKEILKRPETNKQIRKAISICHAHKLKFTIDHILNIPGDSINELIEAFGFYSQIQPTVINTFLLTYYPSAEIIGTAIKEKILNQKDVREINEGKKPTTYSLALGGRRETVRQKHQPNFDQFIFWLTLIPLLPSFISKMILKLNLLRFNFHPPIWLIVLVKYLIRVKIGRSFDTIYTIKLLTKRVYRNLLLRFFLVPTGRLWLVDPI